jgi:lysozyme family protein
MRENFQQAVALVLSLEGGFVDHAADTGGPTNLGITLSTLARARGTSASLADVRALSRDEAAAIYRRFYWDPVRGDELPAGVDLAVFDCAVHSGPRRAVSMLQGLLGVPVDGICGPVTLAAARSRDGSALVTALGDRRLGFLGRLPGAAIFGRGWTRRVAAVSRAALAMVPALHPPHQKETRMNDTKSILTSRTVWSNLVGLVAIGLSLGGFNVAGIDTGPVVDAGLQAIAGASFVASTLFRVIATRKIATAK